MMHHRPHHPWELLTGSLDASVKRWNFSNGRSLRHWQMQSAESDNSSQVGQTKYVALVLEHYPFQAELSLPSDSTVNTSPLLLSLKQAD